ncbi:hypothetical protein JCGZ_14894 [Jatropha curcas]|uniref:Aminotransferase-like plant mobile domain-containing protein n=1 Tax=Jatropha curcas TaxID=180498 RepID=A0A067K6N3_JATCU|nr:hypothetical protein JCGZ_14894 [Jatropha curcas]
MVFRFWAERIRTHLEAWRELPEEARPAAPAYTREERDQAARSFLFYIISSQLLCTSQNKGDPAVLACLRDLSQVGSFDWATLGWAHLYHSLDVWTRGSAKYPRHWPTAITLTPVARIPPAEAGGAAAPAGPACIVLGDVPFPPDMEVVLDPSLGLGSGIVIPADLRQALPPVQLDPEHATHVSHKPNLQS